MVRFREDSLMFFGAVTAGQCHELTNALNIVNELAGLQQDLIAGAEHGRDVDLPRLSSIAGRIQAQIERAEAVIRYINRLAHGVDEHLCVFDLREALAVILSLATHAARLSQTRLVWQLPEQAAALQASPLALQQAVFACIEAALAGTARQHREVIVGCALMEDGAEIEIMSADPIDQAAVALRLDLLKLLVAELNGKLTEVPGTDSRRFAIVVPAFTPPRIADQGKG